MRESTRNCFPIGRALTVRLGPVAIGYTTSMLILVWVPLIPVLALALLLGAERLERGLDVSAKVG